MFLRTIRSRRGIVIAAVLSTAGAASPVWAASETYQIDNVHSDVIFEIGHLGVSSSFGRFNDISGEIHVDTEDAAETSIQIQIKSESVDTNSADRDKHLRSPDFFNVKQFPLIEFQSKSTKVKGDKLEVTGDLTLLGVTKPVTVEVRKIGEGKDPWGGYRAGWLSEFKIKRSDYGMKFLLEGLSDEVEITVALEAVRK